MKCPNCGVVQTGRYCANCGQDNRRARLTLKTLLADALEQYLRLDSRVWRTLGELAWNPGRVVRRYNAGMRRRYVNPLGFLLAMTLLWWTVVYLANPAETIDLIEDRDQKLVYQYGRFLNLFIVPVLALPQWLIFRGGPFGLVQHLALVMFVFGQLFLLRAAVAGTSPLIPVGWLGYWGYVDAIVMVVLYVSALVFSLRGRCRWLAARVVVAVPALFLTSGLMEIALIRLLSWLLP